MQEYSSCKICEGKIIQVNEKHNLGECTKCKLIFCLKKYTQQEFITLYDALYSKDKMHYQRHSKDEFDRLINGKSVNVGFNRSRLLKKVVFTKECKSVLEIGSGVGLIGYYIRGKNPKISYTGVELDKEAFEKSRKLNLNTIHGDFASIEKIEGKFDVIMLWEVIEHLQDLKLILYIQVAIDQILFV
jgi:2-polyprenyl-3-methyl-5-hydroxy-6-metoxy-1,4-benzoquinol methylase